MLITPLLCLCISIRCSLLNAKRFGVAILRRIMPYLSVAKGGDAPCLSCLDRHFPDDANLSHGLAEALVVSPADEAGYDLIQTEANGLSNDSSVVLAAVIGSLYPWDPLTLNSRGHLSQR